MAAERLSRRRALGMLAAVPAALALGAALPPVEVAAVEPVVAETIGTFDLVWHEPLTPDELEKIRRIMERQQALIVRLGWTDRWIEADEHGHVTLTWDLKDGAVCLEWLGIIWQTSMSTRRVPYSVSYDPIPGTPTRNTVAR